MHIEKIDPLTKNPLISIITVVRNAEDCLEETILSIQNQTYKHIEYIVKNELNIYVLPVEVEIAFDEQEIFNESIKDFLRKFKV